MRLVGFKCKRIIYLVHQPAVSNDGIVCCKTFCDNCSLAYIRNGAMPLHISCRQAVGPISVKLAKKVAACRLQATWRRGCYTHEHVFPVQDD